MGDGWIFVKLRKGNDTRLFALFADDGAARDMTHGLGDVYSGRDFKILYDSLVADGYAEVAI